MQKGDRMRHHRTAGVVGLLLGLALAGACDRGQAPPDGAAEAGTLDGLSPDQIRQQAEAISPERAEELGIIDSTIHLEQLTSPGDSLILQDTTRRPAADTAR